MYCESCGKQIAEGSKFCDFCGAPVLSSPQPAAEDLTQTAPLPMPETDPEPFVSNQGGQYHTEYGYANQGYPSQGYQEQGYANQGYQNQGYSNQGYPNQGYPNQGGPYDDGHGRQKPERKKKDNGGSNVLIIILAVAAAILIAVLIFVCIKFFGKEQEEPETFQIEMQTDAESSGEGQTEPQASQGAQESQSQAASQGAQASQNSSEAQSSSGSQMIQMPTTQAVTTVAAAVNEDYILPDSSSRYLSESELTGLTKEQLRIARNEIYARHGRKFKSSDLQQYFLSKSWYHPTVESGDFNENVFNDYELKNRKLIADYEKKMGY